MQLYWQPVQSEGPAWRSGALEDGADGSQPADLKFLAAVLLVCAVGALWLLFAPGAFGRRALGRHSEELEDDVLRQRAHDVRLERWRDGLEDDPSVIEKEARKLGYGRAGERPYPIAANQLTSEQMGPEKRGLSMDLKTLSAIARRTVAPVLMLVIVGAIGVLFLADLKVEDSGEAGTEGSERRT